MFGILCKLKGQSEHKFLGIYLTTKKGKAGKVNINYNNSFRWSEAINLPDVADAYTYAMYFNKMQLNDGKTAVQFDDCLLYTSRCV